jgi:hypothetical protein
MMRLWQTTLNHQERKYAHLGEKFRSGPEILGRWATSLIRHLLLRSARAAWACQTGCDRKARTGATVVEATSHFVQATATGPLIT